MARISNTKTDPIPLCLQENSVVEWEFFATISTNIVPTLFATYSNIGASTGTQHDILVGIHSRLIPALSNCNLIVGEQQANYQDPTQWNQQDFEEFYWAFRLGRVENVRIQNLIGKMSTNQLSTTSVTSFSSAQLLQNFQRVSKSMIKLFTSLKIANGPSSRKVSFSTARQPNAIALLTLSLKLQPFRPVMTKRYGLLNMIMFLSFS